MNLKPPQDAVFPLKGIIPPLVTPLSGDDALDLDAFGRVIERAIEAGVHGLFVLGTTGEGPALSQRLRRDVVQQAMRMVRGRVPVLVGVTDSALVDSLSLADAAAAAGAAAVVTAGPCYFPASQEELFRYFQRFASECSLPVFLYNMPSHTKVAFEVATVRRLSQIERIAGIKDSSAQMLFFQQLLGIASDRPDFTVLIGPEELLAEAVLLGGHGGVCGGANLAPELYVELYEAAVVGDLLQVLKLQQRVLRLASRLYRVGEGPSAYLAGLKAALACQGIGNGRLAPPSASLSPEQAAVIERHLRDLQIDRVATRESC